MKFFTNLKVVKKITYIYLALFIFLIFYTYYRAEFIHNGQQFTYYYKYYLIFIISSIFWFLVLFLNIKFKKYIIILATSLIFILYFYETVRFFAPTIFNLNFIKLINNEYREVPSNEQKSKLDVINELKINKNIEAAPSFFPKALLTEELSQEKIDIFPLGGISNIITVFCKEGTKYSIYKSDRYGFNNLDTEWDEKELFWFLVGDSFTQGSCVQQNENFASHISTITQRSAISVGMSGNGPLIELASLKEYATKEKPKIVLWIYFERNDLDDLKTEKNSLTLLKYLNVDFSQNLNLRQKEIDNKIKKYIYVAKKNLTNKTNINKKKPEKFHTFNKILRLQIIRDKMALDRGLEFGIDPLFKQIMKKAKNLTNSWGGELYFVYLPDKERYSNHNVEGDNYLKKAEIIKIIRNLNIQIIDVHKDFLNKQSDPLNFYANRIYGHYSPDGYKKIAEFIIRNIKINN